MINEIKVNLCLTIDLDESVSIKELEEHIKNSLNIKPQPYFDLLNVDIVKKQSKEPNY